MIVMKKWNLVLAVFGLLVLSCTSEDNGLSSQDAVEVDMSDFYVQTEESEDLFKTDDGEKNRNCYSMAVLNRQLKENPGLYRKMYDIEKHTRSFIASKKPDGVGNGNNGGGDPGGGGGDPVDDGLGAIDIPVYIYVIYSNSQQNISDQQINSQITVLNNDFNDTNYNDVPAEFQPVAADIDIHFTLGVVNRIFDSRSSWGTRDEVKAKYPAQAGYLTIWVCNIGGGILGYAQFPGGNASTDGIVVSPQYFGTTGYVSAPFDQGRTATHEIGHWLNLRHIWGDGRCRQDDFVADTPSSDRPNYSCPNYPTVHCQSNDMTMNYMDYTDDACMYMFTQGQKERMRALFAAGGIREGL